MILIKAFLHHLADEIERDAPAVIGLLRAVGLNVPAAVSTDVELGAGVVGKLTDDGQHMLVTPPAPPAAAEQARNVTQNVTKTEGDPFAVHR